MVNLGQTLPVVLLLLAAAHLAESAAPFPTHHEQQQQHEPRRQLLASNSVLASLTVAGPDCIEAFYNTTAQHYAKDDACSFLINQAFAATSASGCPHGGTGRDSATRKCLQKTAGATAAWVSYLTQCPLSNVLTAGKGFSCFQDMASPAEFEAYANGSTAVEQPATRSSGSSARPAAGAVVLAAAAALLGAVVLL